MIDEHATHISLLAAPIYAALLADAMRTFDDTLSAPVLGMLRRDAIAHAQALWRQTLDTPG